MIKKLLFLCVLAGCASTGETEPDPCLSQNGVWYKAANSQRYICVDAQSLKDQINQIWGVR